LVTVPTLLLVLVALVAAGAVWATILSQLMAEIQLFLPAWVRARGLSIFQAIFFGAIGGGSVALGFVAGYAGVEAAFLIAAALLALGASTTKLLPLYDTSGMDRSAAVYWPEPQLANEPKPHDGPVMVQIAYTVSPENEDEFFKAMDWIRSARLRTGAVEWGIYREGETADRLVEVFVVPTWEEHMRQHSERGISTDQDHEARADALSDPPPVTVHFIGVDRMS
jgi:MFS family permease